MGYNLITGTPQVVTLAVPKIKAKNVSPEVTITYRPTDDLTFFGALKRGYKSGSFNVAIAPVPNENNAFGDEKVECPECHGEELDRLMSVPAKPRGETSSLPMSWAFAGPTVTVKRSSQSGSMASSPEVARGFVRWGRSSECAMPAQKPATRAPLEA